MPFMVLYYKMQLDINHNYTHEEIRALLCHCPVCYTEELSLYSQMYASHLDTGREGITCSRCQFDICWKFQIDETSEIIDQYLLDYCKIANIEFRADNQQLALYLNNTYVRDIANNIVDIDKYKSLLMLS